MISAPVTDILPLDELACAFPVLKRIVVVYADAFSKRSDTVFPAATANEVILLFILPILGDVSPGMPSFLP